RGRNSWGSYSCATGCADGAANDCDRSGRRDQLNGLPERWGSARALRNIARGGLFSAETSSVVKAVIGRRRRLIRVPLAGLSFWPPPADRLPATPSSLRLGRELSSTPPVCVLAPHGGRPLRSFRRRSGRA